MRRPSAGGVAVIYAFFMDLASLRLSLPCESATLFTWTRPKLAACGRWKHWVQVLGTLAGPVLGGAYARVYGRANRRGAQGHSHDSKEAVADRRRRYSRQFLMRLPSRSAGSAEAAGMPWTVRLQQGQNGCSDCLVPTRTNGGEESM